MTQLDMSLVCVSLVVSYQASNETWVGEGGDVAGYAVSGRGHKDGATLTFVQVLGAGHLVRPLIQWHNSGMGAESPLDWREVNGVGIDTGAESLFLCWCLCGL